MKKNTKTGQNPEAEKATAAGPQTRAAKASGVHPSGWSPGASKTTSKGASLKGASKAKAKSKAVAVEQEVRSGGPREADPTQPPVDTFGETPTHSPDLSDNTGAPTSLKRNMAPGDFPSPIRLTEVDDLAEVSEKIRMTDKADVLYLWRDQERVEAKPRQGVINLIEARLLNVQGPPLRP